MSLTILMLEGRVTVHVPGALLAQCFGLGPHSRRREWAEVFEAHQALLHVAARLQVDATGWAPVVVMTEYYIAQALKHRIRLPG